MIFIALGYIVFDWAFYLKKAAQTPYHFNCKLAREGKTSGKPCAMCERKDNAIKLQKRKTCEKMIAQYEKKFNKPFSKFTDTEMLTLVSDPLLPFPF